MRLLDLRLTDFRSYPELALDLAPGITILLGPNGYGKTNVLEAVEYLSTLSSHRVAHDAAMVRRGAASAVLHGGVERAGRTTSIDIEMTPGKSNRVLVQGQALPRTRDLVGTLRSVLFSPEDLSLVKSDPDGRRRFLDTLLITIAPRYGGLKADYDRVLKQRNALLKSLRRLQRGGRSDPVGSDDAIESAHHTLQVWNDQLAEFGAELMRARIHLVNRLRKHVRYSYLRVAEDYEEALDLDPATRGDVDSPLQVRYASAALTDDPRFPDPLLADLPQHEDLRQALLDQLQEKSEDEVDRGVTLVGPHRDDLDLELHGFPAKGYASHGESWSIALALRLGSFDLLRTEEGALGDGEPVLLLDDVFAELDMHRRRRLAAIVADAEQVIVTTANDADVPDRLHERARIIDVVPGVATHRDGTP